MNRSVVYDKVDIDISVGDPAFSEIKNLRYNGVCIGTKIVHISSATAVNQSLNVGVNDSNGAVVGTTDFRDFISNGGGYEEGFKPCRFDTKNEITVDAKAAGNIATADFKAQLIFMIEEECNQ